MKKAIFAILAAAALIGATTAAQASVTRCRPDGMGGMVCTTSQY